MLRVMPAVIAAGGELSALIELDSTTLGAAASEITFSGFSADYTDLMVSLFGRGDTAAESTGVRLRFNGDTAGNYDRQNLQGNASSTSASENFAQTEMHVAVGMSAANAPANVASGAALTILDYSRTPWQKTVLSQSNLKQNTTTGKLFASAIAGFWRDTSAITSITLFPSAGNFDTDTIATLWAWR